VRPPTEDQVARATALLPHAAATRAWAAFDGWAFAPEAERARLVELVEGPNLPAKIAAARAAQAAALGRLPLEIPANPLDTPARGV